MQYHNIINTPWLFEEETTAGVQYTSEMIGEPDFARLLEGKPDIFRAPGGLKGKKRRILVIQPSVVSVLNETQTEVFQNCIKQLQQAGTQIYAMNPGNDALEPVETLHYPGDVVLPPLELAELLKHDPALRGKAAKDVLLINEFHVDDLGALAIGVPPKQHKTFNVRSIFHLQQNGVNLKAYCDYLSQCTPYTFHWVQSDPGHNAKITTDALRSLGQTVDETIDDLILGENVTDQNSLSSLIAPFLYSNPFNSLTIKLMVNAAEIKFLNILLNGNGHIRNILFNEFDFFKISEEPLHALSHVERLTFDLCQNIDLLLGKLIRHNTVMHYLQVLEVHGEFSLHGLNQLIARAPKLTTLKLRGADFENVSFENFVPGPSIRHLILIDCVLSANALLKLQHRGFIVEIVNNRKPLNELNPLEESWGDFLTSLPNTISTEKTLVIKNRHFWQHGQLGYSRVKMTRYPFLEKLVVEDCDADDDIISQIISVVPLLKHLTIKQCDICLEFPEHITFPNLEYLSLSAIDDITHAEIQFFIDHAPNLRVLHLNVMEPHHFTLPKNSKIQVLRASFCTFDNLPKRLWQKNIARQNEGPPPEGFWVDANTNPEGARNIVTHLFVDKNGNKEDPRLFRLHCTNHIDLMDNEFDVNDPQARPFYQTNTGDVHLVSRPLQRLRAGIRSVFENMIESPGGARLYRAKMQRKIAAEYWLPLPSLSPNESLTHLSASGLEPDEYKIEYSLRDSLYYIRLKDPSMDPQDVLLEYIIEVPPVDNQLKNKTLEALVQAYATSQVTQLHFNDNRNARTAQEWLEALITQKGGACRHKAIAFFMEASAKFPGVLFRIVHSDSHDYMEIKEDDNSPWVRQEVGGIPSQIHVNTDNFNESSPTDVISRDVPPNPIFTQVKTFDVDDRYIYALLTQQTGKKIRVDLHENHHVDSFQCRLREIAKAENIPVYTIDSPDDLHCLGTWLSRDANQQADTQEGLGGPLYRFFTDSHAKPPILLINWNNFSPEAIVSSNTVIDKMRMVDNVNLPFNMTVIGVYNPTKTDAYNESDFKRRHDAIHQTTYQNGLFYLEKSHSTDASEAVHIYLHESDDFDSILLGQWDFQGESIPFVEGALLQAHRDKKTVILHDCPFHNRHFINLMAKLKVDKKLSFLGKDYHFEDGFIQYGEAYPLQEKAKGMLSFHQMPDAFPVPADAHVLNPIQVSHLFRKNSLMNHLLYSTPGTLSNVQAGQPLRLYLSHPLTTSQWGRLVEAAHCKIEVYTHGHMTIPPVLMPFIHPAKPVYPYFQNKCLNVFQTKNRDFTISCLKAGSVNPLVIDCTNMKGSELFEGILPISRGKVPKFNTHTGAALCALKEGRDVILTGQLSDMLEQQLVQVAMTQGQTAGKLTLVTERNLPALAPVSNYQLHESFIIPRQAAIHYECHESASAADPMYERARALFSGFQASPIVLLSGPTGVGKTTYMLDHFEKQANVKVFNGLSSILDWAKHSPTTHYPVLFIDEANISAMTKEEYTQFAGMFLNNPPEIVYKGESVKLTPHHKVVFAGNPVQYGGERYIPKLFTEYRHSIVHFNPLSQNYLYQSIIAPKLPMHGHIIGDIFLAEYEKMQAQSASEIFITPRALEHMCNLFVLYIHLMVSQALPDIALRQIAQQIAYHVICNTAPKHAKLPDNPKTLSIEPVLSGVTFSDFILTPSRYPALARLQEMLILRELRIQGAITSSINGILFEGEPGCGKSEIIKDYLTHNGYAHQVYHLSLLMPPAEKEALLIDAYCNGGIVFIDEINSTFMMERLLNDLLSGTFTTTRPVVPGFMIAASQNGSDKAGRREMSPALYQRFIHENIPNYPSEELVYILVHGHHVPQAVAREIVYDFEQVAAKQKPPLAPSEIFMWYKQAIPHIRNTLRERFVDLTDTQKRDLMAALHVHANSSSSSTQEGAYFSSSSSASSSVLPQPGYHAGPSVMQM